MKCLAIGLIISVALLALAGCGGPHAIGVEEPLEGSRPPDEADSSHVSPTVLTQPVGPEGPVIDEPWIWFTIMAVAVGVGIGVLIAADEPETVFRISSGPEMLP